MADSRTFRHIEQLVIHVCFLLILDTIICLFVNITINIKTILLIVWLRLCGLYLSRTFRLMTSEVKEKKHNVKIFAKYIKIEIFFNKTIFAFDKIHL